MADEGSVRENQGIQGGLRTDGILLQCLYQFDTSFPSNEKSDPKAAQIAIICLLYLGEYLFREDACYRNTA